MSTFTFDRQAFDVVPLGFDDLLCFKMITLCKLHIVISVKYFL